MVIDKYGKLINSESEMNLTVSVSMTSKNYQADALLEDEIEGGMIEKRSAELFTWPKLRNILTQVTDNFRPLGYHTIHILRFVGIASAIVLIVVCLVIFIKTFNMGKISITQNGHIINMINSLSVTHYATILQYANAIGIGYTKSLYDSIIDPDEEISSSIHRFSPEDTIYDWTADGINSFLSLFIVFSDAMIDGFNMHKDINLLRDKEALNRTMCSGPFLTNENIQTNLKDGFISTLWYQFLIPKENFPTLGESSTFCEISTLQLQFPTSLKVVMDSMTDHALIDLDERMEENTAILIAFCVIYLALVMPLTFLPVIILDRFNERILKGITTVTEEGASSASRPICINSEEDKMYPNLQKYSTKFNTSNIILAVLILVCFVIALVFPIIAFSSANADGKSLMNFVNLAYRGASRAALANHILSLTSYRIISDYIISNGIIPGVTSADKGYYDTTKMINQYKEIIEWLQDSHNMFLYGTDNNGFITLNEELKNLHISDKACENVSSSDKHSFYTCLGLDRMLSTFILDSSTLIEGSQETFESVDYIHFEHFATTHLHESLRKSRSIVVSLINELINSGKVSIVMFTVIGAIVFVIGQICVIMLNQKQEDIMRAMLILIRHLPPPVMAISDKLMESLHLHVVVEKEENDDPLEVIFNGTSKPILCVGDNYIVEAVNSKFLMTFNCEANEVIGRRLNTLIRVPFKEDENMTVEDQGAINSSRG